MTNKETINEFIRDMTSIVPRSKAEVRQRLNDILSFQRAEWEEEIEICLGSVKELNTSHQNFAWKIFKETFVKKAKIGSKLGFSVKRKHFKIVRDK